MPQVPKAVLTFLLLLGGAWPTAAAGKGTDPLDQAAVRRHYVDGDFDPAIAILEDFQKSRSRFTREESVMVYKYLGVMYSADPTTREKGKSYFYKLLAVDPEAKILDMYVSIVVQDIFKSTLEELMGIAQPPTRRPQPLADNAGGEGSSGKTADAMAEARAGKSRSAYWWLGGIGIAAGIAGGYYAYTVATEAPDDVNIPVP